MNFPTLLPETKIEFSGWYQTCRKNRYKYITHCLLLYLSLIVYRYKLTCPADASVGRLQNGEGTAGRAHHVPSGPGSPGHRGPVHRHHRADIRVQLDSVLLRVHAVQRVREAADGRPEDRGRRILEPDAVLRQRTGPAGRRRVRESAAVQRHRRVPVVPQRCGFGVPVELHRARVRLDSHVVRAHAQALLDVQPAPVLGV